MIDYQSSDTNPQISVLMSCFNAEEWLHEAIKSVLNQSFKNFELILIDDGSTNNTWEIIQSYRNCDDRIVAISKEHTGLCNSLNIGISAARGTWIARLDADDLCEPTRLEEQFKYVCDHPDIVLLGSGFNEIDAHGKLIKKQLYPSNSNSLTHHLESLQRFFPHSSAFYRTDVVQQIGGYQVRFNRAQDMHLWLNLSDRGKLACLPRALVSVRRHFNQISLDCNGKRQLYDGVIISVCHIIKRLGSMDLVLNLNDAEWNLFCNWIEQRADEFAYFKRRNAWNEARCMFFSEKNIAIGAYHFSRHILQSGYGLKLFWEKFFGTTIPYIIAKEWIKYSALGVSLKY